MGKIRLRLNKISIFEIDICNIVKLGVWYFIFVENYDKIS